MDSLEKIEFGKLILDYKFQPRQEVDPTHVRSMVDFLESGHSLPPIVVDRETLRVTSGFHRYHALKKFGIQPKEEIDVILRDYFSEEEMFLDATRENASHGKPLTSYDKAVIAVKSQEFNITREEIAAALSITVDRYDTITRGRVGSIITREPAIKPPPSIIKKRSVQHIESFTPEQAQVNEHLSGWKPSFHARQLIMLLESNMIDFSDEDVIVELTKLKLALDGILIDGGK